jgi:hypothetical protein
VRLDYRQSEFNIDASAPDGLDTWRRQREHDLGVLARRVGLPIGHETEVWLKGGIRLKGLLRLFEERLFLADETINEIRLEIQGVKFSIGELESCVRLD